MERLHVVQRQHQLYLNNHLDEVKKVIADMQAAIAATLADAVDAISDRAAHAVQQEVGKLGVVTPPLSPPQQPLGAATSHEDVYAAAEARVRWPVVAVGERVRPPP